MYILGEHLFNCVSLGKSVHLSEPLFCHHRDGDIYFSRPQHILAGRHHQYNGHMPHCGVWRWDVSSAWRTTWQYPSESQMHLSLTQKCTPWLNLCMYTEGVYGAYSLHRHLYNKKLQCLLRGNLLNKVWHIHAREYCKAMKISEEMYMLSWKIF